MKRGRFKEEQIIASWRSARPAWALRSCAGAQYQRCDVLLLALEVCGMEVSEARWLKHYPASPETREWSHQLPMPPWPLG